jgi:hypothetical protein
MFNIFLIPELSIEKLSAKSINFPGCKACLNSCGLNLILPVFNLKNTVNKNSSLGQFFITVVLIV